MNRMGAFRGIDVYAISQEDFLGKYTKKDNIIYVVEEDNEVWFHDQKIGFLNRRSYNIDYFDEDRFNRLLGDHRDYRDEVVEEIKEVFAETQPQEEESLEESSREPTSADSYLAQFHKNMEEFFESRKDIQYVK